MAEFPGFKKKDCISKKCQPREERRLFSQGAFTHTRTPWSVALPVVYIMLR
jgi:hypothetical protein